MGLFILNEREEISFKFERTMSLLYKQKSIHCTEIHNQKEKNKRKQKKLDLC